MFSKDSANRTTQRFSGIEFVPPSILVRGHGESSGRISNLVSLDTRFNDVVPAVYGTGWLQAPVVFSRNDGNLTRCEVLLGLGEIDSVIKVVADGFEIPEGINGQNMTGTGWFNLVSLGNRTGALNLGLTDAAANPVGDPYASMAYLNLVLPNRINDGKKSPKVEVLWCLRIGLPIQLGFFAISSAAQAGNWMSSILPPSFPPRNSAMSSLKPGMQTVPFVKFAALKQASFSSAATALVSYYVHSALVHFSFCTFSPMANLPSVQKPPSLCNSQPNQQAAMP
jgi:hypothetical protein